MALSCRISNIETPADAAAVVRTVQFACGAAAGERLVIVQIESRAGVEQIDKIAAVDGIDVFLIGPNDLAYSLTGVRGAQSPEVEAAIDHICARLKFAGQRFGMPMQLRDVDVFRRRGATFVYYSANWLLQSGMMELNRAIGR